MNKLTKGIKKKVKGKKKPTQEELEQEELRQYRLEKQREKEELEKQEAEQAAEEGDQQKDEDKTAAVGQPQETAASESAEWAKFRELTSGVDSVLSSTKESLQTIKETSYFIRKKVPSEQKEKEEKAGQPAEAVATPSSSTTKPKWVDVDAEEQEAEEAEPEPEPVPEECTPKLSTPDKPEPIDVLTEVEKLERAQFFEEDVFNTEYVEAVTSGDIGLAVIPDSPTDDGEDPFDTSAVDKVLHVKAEDPKKKKLKVIALGKAVEVLSGTQNVLEQTEDVKSPSETGPERSKRRKRGVYRRPGSLDLLGTEDQEEDSEQQKQSAKKVSTPNASQTAPKALLDEDLEDNGEFKLNLAVTQEQWNHEAQPVTIPAAEDKKKSLDNQISALVSEFEESSGHSETASNQQILSAKPPDEEDCEFDSLAAESLLRAKDREELIGEDDPFDTSAAQSVLKDNTSDLPQVDEGEIKFDVDFGDKSAPPHRPPPPVIITSPERPQLDFLTSNEHHDYEPLPDPIKFSANEPSANTESIAESQEEVDPFDTTVADKLCGTEIKILESELINSSDPSAAVELVAAFDDFDPRADEEKPEVDPFDTAFASGFVKQPTADITELLESSASHDTTPVVLPPTAQPCEPEPEFDPFDTSIADSYSNVEIKVIENELLNTVSPAVSSDIGTKLDLSVTSAPPPRPPPPPAAGKANFEVSFDEEDPAASAPSQPEILSLTPIDEDVAPVSLVPQRASDPAQTEEADPFDTSIANKFGTAEVGVLERELLAEAPVLVAKQITDLLPDLATESSLDPCKAEGADTSVISLTEEEPDPFDTTYVDALDIAKISETDGGRISKPKTLQVSANSVALLANTPEDPNPPLQPSQLPVDVEEEIDPFDTSVADQFGLTELRVLESELIGGVKCHQNPPAPSRAPPPSPRTPAASAVTEALVVAGPSVDQLLKASPTSELPPTLLPSFDSALPPRELSPVLLDPFDTSIADQYSNTELKVLEQEFVDNSQGTAAVSSVLKRSVSDYDFDPRGDEKVLRPASPPAPAGHCLLSLNPNPESIKTQVLAATVVAPLPAEESEEADPFDTSIANCLLPGQAELQVIERELLHS